MTSRRAFNQQYVLYNSILQELERACPLLTAKLQNRKNDEPYSNTRQVDVEVTYLQSPWTTTTYLKKHLLSDPTAKSRDKFVAIVETLLSHEKLAQVGTDLRTVFANVVRRIVYEISITTSTSRASSTRTNSPAYDAHSELSSAGSGSSMSVSAALDVTEHGAASVFYPHRSANSSLSTSPEPILRESANINIRMGSAREPSHSPPITQQQHSTRLRTGPGRPASARPPLLRYRTRSTPAHTALPNITAAMYGTAYNYRGVVHPRLQRTGVIRPASTPATLRPIPLVEEPLLSEQRQGNQSSDSSTLPATDYYFDPNVFDDHAEAADGDLGTQPWEYLDDWAFDFSPPQSSQPLHRPSHPIPILGAGFTLSDQPIVNANHHELGGFRSIAHITAESLANTIEQSDEAPQYVLSRQELVKVPGVPVPFPDYHPQSLYARRSAFTPPLPRYSSSRESNLHSAERTLSPELVGVLVQVLDVGNSSVEAENPVSLEVSPLDVGAAITDSALSEEEEQPTEISFSSRDALNFNPRQIEDTTMEEEDVSDAPTPKRRRGGDCNNSDSSGSLSCASEIAQRLQ